MRARAAARRQRRRWCTASLQQAACQRFGGPVFYGGTLAIPAGRIASAGKACVAAYAVAACKLPACVRRVMLARGHGSVPNKPKKAKQYGRRYSIQAKSFYSFFELS
ncbi:hypothetical protein NPIL_51751 [Nephila pilipes]|uniref:Uncharacterized protein n=1 Tax=Nephila pilipes TaxID=299642 RepID=A0A8X6PZA5_NEPPI|nr:hypothetical protein NPIL_51751 [Nephila pilipes]